MSNKGSTRRALAMVGGESQHPIVRSDFTTLLADVKCRIQSAQTRAVLAVNAELVRLYWDIGRIIDDRQRREGWGSAVIPRLAQELKNELPDLKGFSERNIGRMIAFFREYPAPAAILPPAAVEPTPMPVLPQPAAKTDAPAKVPQLAAELEAAPFWSIPWFHHIILMEKVKDLSSRRWYMQQTLVHGWSRNVLALQIDAQAHARHGKAVSNFAGIDKPIGISTYELTRALPARLRSALPTVEQIEAELVDVVKPRKRAGRRKPGGK